MLIVWTEKVALRMIAFLRRLCDASEKIMQSYDDKYLSLTSRRSQCESSESPDSH